MICVGYVLGMTIPISAYPQTSAAFAAQQKDFYQTAAFSSIQLSPLTDSVFEGHEGQFSGDPIAVFCAGGHREKLWHRQGCPLLDVVHPASPLPTRP